VRADDGSHATVEPAGKCGLLARRLRVDVHQDDRGLCPRLLDEFLDDFEHRGRRVEEE